MATSSARQDTAACRAKPENTMAVGLTRNRNAAPSSKPANTKAKMEERFPTAKIPLGMTNELESGVHESFETATWEPSWTPSMVTVELALAPGRCAVAK